MLYLRYLRKISILEKATCLIDSLHAVLESGVEFFWVKIFPFTLSPGLVSLVPGTCCQPKIGVWLEVFLNLLELSVISWFLTHKIFPLIVHSLFLNAFLHTSINRFDSFSILSVLFHVIIGCESINNSLQAGNGLLELFLFLFHFL